MKIWTSNYKSLRHFDTIHTQKPFIFTQKKINSQNTANKKSSAQTQQIIFKREDYFLQIYTHALGSNSFCWMQTGSQTTRFSSPISIRIKLVPSLWTWSTGENSELGTLKFVVYLNNQFIKTFYQKNIFLSLKCFYKGTANKIFCDSMFFNVRFTKVPLEPLSEQKMWFFSTKVTC